MPRYIFLYLDQLFMLVKTDSRLKSIIVNYFRMLKTYFIFGLPVTGILFYASMFGDQNVILKVFGASTPFIALITALLLLITIRLSVLLRKRDLLRKIPLLNGLERFLPKLQGREIKNEYRSYLFDIFFTAFMSAMIILLFKVIFLGDQTIIKIPGYAESISSTLRLFGRLFNRYVFWAFLIPLIAEILIEVIGVYPEFVKRE